MFWWNLSQPGTQTFSSFRLTDKITWQILLSFHSLLVCKGRKPFILHAIFLLNTFNFKFGPSRNFFFLRSWICHFVKNLWTFSKSYRSLSGIFERKIDFSYRKCPYVDEDFRCSLIISPSNTCEVSALFLNREYLLSLRYKDNFSLYFLNPYLILPSRQVPRLKKLYLGDILMMEH